MQISKYKYKRLVFVLMKVKVLVELDPIDFSRNNEFTIQNALFGAIEITKNANNFFIRKYL